MLFLYFKVIKHYLRIPQDCQPSTWLYVVLTPMEVSESWFIIFNKVSSINKTPKYYFSNGALLCAYDLSKVPEPLTWVQTYEVYL